MRSRPILFSAPMVQAILAGTKTQTRRSGKIQCSEWTELAVEFVTHATKGTEAVATYRAFPNGGSARWGICACPYGIAGDQLWIREEHYLFGHWEPIAGKLTKGGRQKWAFIPHPDSVVTFTPPAIFRKGRHTADPATPAWHKRLARFMPRKLSRLTLEITAIGVQRLQNISSSDARAEGIPDNLICLTGRFPTGNYLPRQKYDLPAGDKPTADELAVANYAALWETINGPGSWAENPWVWVVTFRNL